MNKLFVFVFNFAYYDDTDEELEIEHVVELKDGPGVDPTVTNFSDMEMNYELLSDFREKMENQYGIHDWSTSGHPDRFELIGYTTYEVETEGEINELVSKWKEYLESVGYTLGKHRIFELGYIQ